ncbi:MAG: serine hydrolase [Chloroflexota bacterium]
MSPAKVDLTEPVTNKPSAPLAQLLAHAVAGKSGTFGLAVKNLDTGEFAALEGDRVFESASLYKLNLMYGAFAQAAAGEVNFADVLAVSEKAANGYDDGEPSLRPGETTTLAQAVRCAITVSDNASGHALLEHLSVWKVNKGMAALGLPKTEILNGTRTTPGEMLLFLDLLAGGRLVSPEASGEMLSLLLARSVDDRLPALLPKDVPIAHKTGNLPGLKHDVGIVYAPAGPYAIAALWEADPEAENNAEGEVVETIAEVSRSVYDYFATHPTR